MVKQAGVLVIIEQSTQSLILTQRSKKMPIHAGEISFPGGRWQKGDADLKQTALRETEEEIGISPQRLHMIRPLSRVETLTGYDIAPYLAHIDSVTGYQLQPEEVEQIITLPIEQVKQAKSYQIMSQQIGGVKFKTLYYKHPDYLIWGATAKIMLQLIE